MRPPDAQTPPPMRRLRDAAASNWPRMRGPTVQTTEPDRCIAEPALVRRWAL